MKSRDYKFTMKDNLLRNVATENGYHMGMFDLWAFDHVISKDNISEVVDFLMESSYVMLDHKSSKNHPLYKEILTMLQEERRCGSPLDETLDIDDAKYLNGDTDTMSLYRREIVQCSQIMHRIEIFGGRRIIDKAEYRLRKQQQNNALTQKNPEPEDTLEKYLCYAAPAAILFQPIKVRDLEPLPKVSHADLPNSEVTIPSPKRGNSFVDSAKKKC